MYASHLTKLLVIMTTILPFLANADWANARYAVLTVGPDPRRQAEYCPEPNATLCPDGDGCCEIGQVCTVKSGVPLCAADSCDVGVVTCTHNGVTACCQEIGLTCALNSPGFCTPSTVGPGPTETEISAPSTPTLTTEDVNSPSEFPSPTFSTEPASSTSPGLGSGEGGETEAPSAFGGGTTGSSFPGGSGDATPTTAPGHIIPSNGHTSLYSVGSWGLLVVSVVVAVGLPLTGALM